MLIKLRGGQDLGAHRDGMSNSHNVMTSFFILRFNSALRIRDGF